MADVIMPKMGDAMESGTLIAWKVKDGDAVKAGDVIAEIETDKSNVEIEAEDAGTFHVSVAEGTSVPVGGVIATIGNGSAKSAPEAKPASEAKSSTEAKAAAPAEKSAEPKTPAAPANAPKVETSSWKPPRIASPATGPSAERLKASPLARKVARERGIDIAQVTAGLSKPTCLASSLRPPRKSRRHLRRNPCLPLSVKASLSSIRKSAR
jgi:pyruvate dehydrogenase E2 component (dihydrolipoamide acetyltransferase)